MKCASKNTVLKIFYQADKLASGQDVIFNIWDSDGTQLETDTTADGEIASQGVYFLDYTTPNADIYVVVVGSLSDNSNPNPLSIKVGTPATALAIYAEGELQTGQSISYTVFDSTHSTLSSGNLNEIAGGFYKTDVTSLPMPWFFEVHPLTVRDKQCS